MKSLAVGIALVLAALAALHFYWAIRGTAGGDAAVPELNGSPLFRPGRISTLAVGLALLTAGLIVLERGGAGPAFLPPALARWGTGLVALVFLARAMGEFRYVGFFKRVRGTRFARLDSLIYSPLCLAIGAASAVLAVGGS